MNSISRRYEVFARAFGRALEERGRLDLDEFLRVEIVADGLRGAVTHLEVFTHLRPAQVEITVRETQVFVDLITAYIIERERRRIGNIEHLEGICGDLYATGGQGRVDGAFGPRNDFARDANDGLRF